ncbi:MAG: hypothetical protein HY650_06595, partial [Acidobacteria bacterium]|nr:hypothetical protein [Acidobacteriota bacterium]
MFMHTPCLHFVVALLLVLLVGNQVSLGAMPGAAQLCMAGLKQLTVGQTTSRPVVKNRRILWYFGMGTTPSLPTVAVMVADLRTGDPPKATEIVRDAEVLFTGPPDLDEHGNVTYVKRVAGRHQVFLYDGISHLQLTENPALSGSPTIGLGTDKVSPGWPRVASKHVVFRDSAGNVFLYDSNRGMVQKINASDGQTANTGDGRVRSPIFAEVREFEFDGRYIVWLHEDRITPGAESRMTIYRAEPPYEELHKVVEFPAVMGSGAPVSTGSIFYPYFVACADKIAWQYFPRLVPNEATIGYHDGVSARILRTDAPARTQSTRIHNGQVTWLEFAPRPVDAQKVFLFDGTRISEVASFPDPPGNAAVGSRIWTDIHDVDIALGEVVYLAGEVECMGLFPGLCTPQGTNRFGIFKGSAGNTPVAVFETATGGAGVADFDSGLYVFQATCQPGSRDLAYFTVFEPSTASNVSLLLTDTTPQPSVLVTAEEKTVVVDGFKLSVAAKDCGASVNEGAAVTAMTFRGKASSGIDAKLSDIETVELYSDTDANQVIGPDDTLLGQGAFVGSTIRFAFTSPVTVHPGAERHFLLTYELAASVCPCNKYEALLMAGEIEATTTGLQAEPSKVGMSSGRVILPRPEFAMFSSTGMFGGDEQAGFTFGTLPKKLGIRVKDFPVRCGQAKFEISDKTAIGISDARLKIPGRESSRLILPFTQVNEDAVAEVEMRLGEEHGLYLVESTIEFTQPAMCEPPRHLFREHAGVIVLELVDANDPRFYEGTLVPGSPPKWEVKLTPDLDRLSTGGDPRLGTTTDGTSMLLVRLMLLGFMEPPPGQVRISLPAGGLGSLTTGLGSVIPPSSGGISVSVGWKKTSVGIYAFALYTPTLNFGDREITERVITLTAAYSLPGSAGSEEVKTEVVLYRPPVLFVHGMWADKTTWGNAFTSEDPRFEKYFADYSGGEPSGNAISFSENGQVIREAVYHIIQDRRTRRTATTQVIVVAHSMGGLLTRQFIADQDGQSYRRQDNFGQGDIYKFITIGTPHWGSPIAWLTVALRDHPNALVQQPFLEMVNGLGIDILSGAVDSLCPGSKELRSLGGTDVPTHTIMPWYLDTSNTAIGFWDFLKDLVLKIKGLKAGKLARA